MRAIFSKILKIEVWIFAIWIISMSSYGVYVITTNGL
jgi:hypothetical protein